MRAVPEGLGFDLGVEISLAETAFVNLDFLDLPFG